MNQTPHPKIHALLARMGLGSRREIEQWICDGKITVNGQDATIGQRINPEDELTLNGQKIPLSFEEPTRQVIAYYKKVGEICTKSHGRLATVFDTLPPVSGKWVNVGRLDVNTSGLLLFTNDGELAHRLMHPKYEIERHYKVRVFGTVSPAQLKQLKAGTQAGQDFLKFEAIESPRDLKEGHQNQWFHVVLKEGKYREVRRLFESIGCKVSRLIRVQYGPYVLPKQIKPGQYAFLSVTEIHTLLKAVGIKF